MVCSGFAALGYEIVWTRLLTPMLGSETLGVLATLAGFFGGMAVGALALHRRAAIGADPLGLFVRLELAAAAFAIVSPYLLHALGEAIPRWMGPHAGDQGNPGVLAAAIAIAALTMMPGTLCLGATLACVTEARRRACVGDDDGRGVARLYGANTAGAVLGALLGVHVVVPTLGLGGGAIALACAGAGAAALARSWGRQQPAARAPPKHDEAPAISAERDPDPDAREPLPLLVLVFGAGMVGVGLEVIGTLVLSQLFENTIYTFANVLAVFLAGTAIGAWAWGARGPALAHGRPATAAAVLLLALALSTVVAAIALAQADAIVQQLAPDGSSASRHQLAELTAAGCVFGVPTVLMGALFSHTMGLVAPSGLGRAYALNTVGGAIAPFVFGVWAPISLGYRDAFYLVVYAYLLVFGVFTWFRRFRPLQQIGAIVVVVAATALGPSSMVFVAPDEGWRVISQRESAMGLVVVSERIEPERSDAKRSGATPLRRLQIGKHFRMGGALSFGERRMGQLPLLLAPQAKTALFLGLGTGATLGAVRSFDGLERIDAVELSPAVLDALPSFASTNADVTNDPRVHLVAADARRFVAASPERWDVIVADLFHPGIDGAGSLYAREHFEHVREHLREGGLFAQWLPLHQLDLRTLPIVACTFQAVFPDAHAFLGIYNVRTPALALVARSGGEPLRIEVDALAAKLRAPVYAELLMQDPRDLLASHLLGPAGLRELCGDAPLNTDLWPRITLLAPEVAYEGMGTHARENLARVLELREPLAPELVIASDDRRAAVLADIDRFGDALAAYLRGESLRADAEDEHEAAGRSGAPPFPADAIAAWREAFAAAPEFTAARGMLVEAARRDPAIAEQVLPELLAALPDDQRLWQLWLAHLRASGDTARFEAALAEAKARFEPQAGP